MVSCQTEEDHLVQGHLYISLGKAWAGMMQLWEAFQLQGQLKAHPSQKKAEEASIQDQMPSYLKRKRNSHNMLQKERADGVQSCRFPKTEARNKVSFNNYLGILFWGLRSGEKVHENTFRPWMVYGSV